MKNQKRLEVYLQRVLPLFHFLLLSIYYEEHKKVLRSMGCHRKNPPPTFIRSEPIVLDKRVLGKRSFRSLSIQYVGVEPQTSHPHVVVHNDCMQVVLSRMTFLCRMFRFHLLFLLWLFLTPLGPRRIWLVLRWKNIIKSCLIF